MDTLCIFHYSPVFLCYSLFQMNKEQSPLKLMGYKKHTFTVLSLDPLTILCMSTSVHVMAPVKNNRANIEQAKPQKSAVGFNV